MSTRHEAAKLLVIGNVVPDLAKPDIDTFRGLVRHAATHGLRLDLVKQAPAFSTQLLERAAALADLIDQHPRVDIALGNVLDRAGVGSIADRTGGRGDRFCGRGHQGRACQKRCRAGKPHQRGGDRDESYRSDAGD